MDEAREESPYVPFADLLVGLLFILLMMIVLLAFQVRPKSAPGDGPQSSKGGLQQPLVSDKSRVEAQIKELLTQIAKLNDQRQGTQAKLEAATRQVGELEKQLVGTRSQVAQAEQNAAKSRREEKEQQAKSEAARRAEHETLQGRLKELERAFAAAHAEGNAAKAGYATAQRDLVARSERIQRLEGQLSQAQSKQAQLDLAMRKIAELESQLAGAHSQVAQAGRLAAKARQEEKEQYAKSESARRAELQTLQGRLQELERALAEAQADGDAARAAYPAAQRALAARSERIQLLEGQLDQLQSKLREAELKAQRQEALSNSGKSQGLGSPGPDGTFPVYDRPGGTRIYRLRVGERWTELEDRCVAGQRWWRIEFGAQNSGWIPGGQTC